MQSYKDLEIYQLAPKAQSARRKTQDARRKAQSSQGVTLIELIMVIVVVGVLAGGLSLGINEVIELWGFLTFRNEIASQGRMSLMRMGREIRQIKDNSSINVAGAMQFQFDDINDNNITYCRADADCNYDINGGYLCRNNNIMASEVTNLALTYYAEDNSELTNVPLSAGDRQDVYRIVIILTLSNISVTRTLTLRSQIYPRNL